LSFTIKQMDAVTSPMLVLSLPTNASVTVKESFSLAEFDNLMRLTGVDEATKKRLKKFHKKKVCGPGGEFHVLVVYKLGEKHAAESYGRWYAQGPSLQNFPRDICNALVRGLATEVDDVNAQLVYLAQVCHHEGWECAQLDSYVAERETWLSEIVSHNGFTREDAKAEMIRFIFGGGNVALLPPSRKEFAIEISRILDNLVMRFPDVACKIKTSAAVKEYKGSRFVLNKRGIVCSMILQTIERIVADEKERALTRLGFPTICRKHDAHLARLKRLPDGQWAGPSAAELKEVEASVLKATGWRTTLKCKELTTSIAPLANDASAYMAMKISFEQAGTKGCKVGSNFFARLSDGSHVIEKKHDFATRFEHMRYGVSELSDGEPFIGRWLDDPLKKVYETLGIFPPGGKVCPATTLNLWNGFVVETLAPIQDNERAKLAIEYEHSFVGHERVICDGDEVALNFKLDFYASIFQQPGNKTSWTGGPPPAILVYGPRGAGKDTQKRLLRDMIGPEYAADLSVNTAFGTFSGALEGKVLVTIEDANFRESKVANAYENFKARVTGDMSALERKGKDGGQMTNIARFMLTSNEPNAVPTSGDDRQLWEQTASLARVGDAAYFTRIYANHANPRFLRFVYEQLMSRDLSIWVTNAWPRSKLQDVQAEGSVRNEVIFARHFIGDKTGVVVVGKTDMWQQYREWHVTQGFEYAALNLRKFNTAILSNAHLLEAVEEVKSSTMQWRIDVEKWRAVLIAHKLDARPSKRARLESVEVSDF